MVSAWRISKAKHIATALSGEGSFLVAGRWNNKGRRVVYASQTLSLAALETLVHIDNVRLLASYLHCRIGLPDDTIEYLDLSILPTDWKGNEGLTRSIGAAWLDSERSAVLAVPSAIIDIEWNYLIHPNHPDFHSNPAVEIDGFQPFTFDRRLK
jgi:RES domain-containing protein